MNHDANMPEQRHDDLVSLKETVHSINSTLRSVTKVVLAAIMPMLMAGIITLVGNHFQQKALIVEVGQLNSRMTKMSDQVEHTNEKVIVMWASGDWETKYKTKQLNE